ncbi:SMP-30/gluconolactonase/LRE family protein [Meridianimarinicoccus aquatilis]|uniref:SMP-30/gluconolactonase/LRE family protein n=2 Tax=Meridianimarinicoccus aquatilis TaxID=2552766 RepID=A0A4R6AZ73_9RHOB|nr:SMP-30/gluconolactonase/LRE family protein [Fluviibacterium aquatile]
MMATAGAREDIGVSFLDAQLLVDCKNLLGEGVQWHPRRRRLFWTDIKGQALWSCDEVGGNLKTKALDAPLCSFAFCDDGRMLGAFADGLAWLDPITGQRRLFEDYQTEAVGVRMNDGGVDRQGRFVVGGIDEAERKPITPVWSVDRGRVRVVIDDVAIANSIAFSPDGRVMYFTDTVEGEIRAYDYNPATGTPSKRRSFVSLGEGEGKPDGSTVDVEGGLWNARFGGGAVARYLPDGTLDTIIRVPVPNVTSCALGGPTMRRLFITTAQIEMTPAMLDANPQAGGLYVVDVPVRGIQQVSYKR